MFDKAYLELRGLDPAAMADTAMPIGAILGELVRSLVVAYVLARFVVLLGVVNWLGAVQLKLESTSYSKNYRLHRGYMGKVVLDITMSLDGFIAGPNVDSKQPMGEGGPRLHEWMFAAGTDIDAKVADEVLETSGAAIVGGRTYKVAIDEAWGGASPFTVPAFVLSKAVPAEVKAGFTYVTDGIESALRQAQAAAGDKNVWIMGGANTAQQYLKAGLIDEMQIHLVPVLLGTGTQLFEHIGADHIELESTRVIASPGVTHLTFHVAK